MTHWRIMLAGAIVLVAACHGDSSNAPFTQSTTHIKTPPAVKRGPTPDELTAGMVEAVTIGRSTVPVAVKFDLPHIPVVGQPLDVMIAVMPQIAASPAIVTISGSEVLLLSTDGGPIEIPVAEPTQVYRQRIKLTPTAEGVHLLGVSVSLQHDDITETRSFSVPVIVTHASAGLASSTQR